jgi:hypothetical protein
VTHRPVVVYNVQRLLRPTGSTLARALDATTQDGWDAAAYKRKVRAVGAMLSDATQGTRPAILVLIEVEDASVVRDVCAAAGWPQLVDLDIANEQVEGYDIGVVYDPALFTGHSDAQSFTLENRFATRDVLLATLEGTHPLKVMASHWASRTLVEGEVLRIAAAFFCTNLLERLVKFGKEDLFTKAGQPKVPSRERMTERWNTPILVAADLNDSPWDRSVRALLNSTPEAELAGRPPRLPAGKSTNSAAAYLRLRPRLYNPSWQVVSGPGGGPPGTHRFGDDWSPLDQILVSAGMLNGSQPSFVPGSIRVHGPTTLKLPDGTEIRARQGDGTPIAFNAKTGVGVADHLPLVGEIDI